MAWFNQPEFSSCEECKKGLPRSQLGPNGKPGGSPHYNCCNDGASWEGKCHGPHMWKAGADICKNADAIASHDFTDEIKLLLLLVHDGQKGISTTSELRPCTWSQLDKEHLGCASMSSARTSLRPS